MVKTISNVIQACIICICCLSWLNDVLGHALEPIPTANNNERHIEQLRNHDLEYYVREVNIVNTSQNLGTNYSVITNRTDGLGYASINSINVKEQNDERSAKTRRETNEKNLCHSVCECKLSNNFLTADCAFQQQFVILKPNIYFPNSTTSVQIRLSQKAGLRIDENMFINNKINRISIQGTHPHGQEHLEISSKAFFGNMGPFPEIEIKNVHTVLVQANAFYREFKLNIVDCSKVVIFAEAFSGTKFNGYFDNIPNLILFEKAFFKSDAKIYINKCVVERLERLETPLKEIKFTNSHINEITTGAFDVLSINSIIIENCDVDIIHKNALTERLFSNYFAIIGSRIGTIETGSIAGSGITDVIFTNNSINTIREKAMSLTSINVQITNNNINFLERFWIKIEHWSNVTIAHNRFGEYNQMMVEQNDPKSKPVHCLFENNFITVPRLGSLNFKSPLCRIREISFNQPCTCNSSLFNQLALNDYRTQYYCTIDATLAHCFNATLFNVLDYERKICDDSSKIDCLQTTVNIKRDGSFINLNDIIKNSKKLFYICLVAGLLTALVLVIMLFYSIRCYIKKDVASSPARDMVIMASLHPLTPKKSSMFSNSDLVIIQESLERLKEKYPAEVYDQVHNNTKKLIVGDLREAEKVGIIGEIVKSLVDCQDMGTELVAFTNILYNHLEPNQEDRIYFEPEETLNATNNGLYAISGNQLGATRNNGDPIYAEPNNVQMPLLKNEYMQPADRAETDVAPLYSEPVFDSSAKVTGRPFPPLRNNNVEVTYSQVNKPSSAIAVPSTSKQSSSNHPIQLPKRNSLIRTNLNTQYNSSTESNSCSEHSGGSGDTLQIDDIYKI